MKSSMVFLSSTVDDMEKERDAAAEVLNFLHQKVSRCEYYPARTNSPKEICLSEASNCDVFIGIYKNRYGFIPEDANQESFSVIELEYNEAKKANKPILLFYYQDASKRETKLDNFLDKVKNFSKGHYVKKFSNTEELKYLILQSLVSQFKYQEQFTQDEVKLFNNLVPDLTNYQRVILNQFELGDPHGIARPTVLLPYRIRDLFVPPELKKDDSLQRRKIDEYLFTDYVEFPSFETSWEDIEEMYNKGDVEGTITTGINILEKLEDKKPNIILGGPGSGKSTLLKFLCSDLILNSSIIPFYIQVKDLSSELEKGNIWSVVEYLQKKFSEIKLNPDFFHTQLNAGSCLVIFDGLDEVWNIKERIKVNEMIQQFCSVWSIQNKIIISSRLAGYEQNPLIGNFEKLKLEPFTKKKIREYIIKWAHMIKIDEEDVENKSMDENASNLLSVLVEDEHLIKIVSSPIILNIFCLAFMKNITFPKRKHLLYSILIETLLSSWEKRKGIDKQKLDWTEYVKILRKISFWMFDNNKSQIEQQDLYNLIKNHLKKEGISEGESDSVRNIITNLEERSGIIINDGSGNFVFYHLSFLEYLVALEFTTDWDIPKIFEYFEPTLFDGKNFEIISFISSLLSDKTRNSSSEFLKYILERKSEYDEIHILTLLLVINSLASGATVTENFKETIFSRIDKVWDKRRIYDITFFSVLQGLLQTPLEKDIVDLWRQKCSSDPFFYHSNLTDHIISQSRYDEELIQFCEVDLKNENLKLYSSLRISDIIQMTHSKKIIRYVLEHKKSEEMLHEVTILGIAKVAKNDIELGDLYFEKLEKIKNTSLQISFLKYANHVDKDRAITALQKLSMSNNSANAQKLFLGKIKPTHIQQFKARFDLFLESSEETEGLGIGLGMFIHAMSSEFYPQMFDIIFDSLAKIPLKQKNHALILCGILDRFVQDHEELHDLFRNFVSEIDEKCINWKKFLLGVIAQINEPTEEYKKIQLTMLLDENEDMNVRRHCIDNLVRDYPQDEDFAENIPILFPNHEFQTLCLDFMTKNPEVLIKNKELVSDAYYTGPLENYYALPVDVIRTYMSIITSTN